MTEVNRITESQFIEVYGDVLVGSEPNLIPLAQALKIEELVCPADKSERQDPAKRLSYLARMVGSNLLDEHRYMIIADEQ